MRKEILFAILAGAIFGLIIAFGVWRANLALKPAKAPSVTQDTPEEKAEEFGLTIAKPQNSQVITNAPVTVTGITSAGSWVAISAEEKDYLLPADESGSFEQEVDLIGGVNEIIVTAYDTKGTWVSERLLLVFSTEFGEQIGQALPSPTATQEADTVREKVAEKVARAKNVPVAYFGTITDISEATLQIKNQDEEILQVSVVKDETTFVKVNKVSKKISFSDVAIGDFIVAMGFAEQNAVLEAKRVLITSPIEPSTRHVVYGEVTEIAKKTVSLTLADNTSWTAEFGKRWEGPELTQLAEGTKVIILGEAEDSTLSVRTLFIIAEETSTPSPSPSPTPTP